MPLSKLMMAGNFRGNRNPFWTDQHAEALIKDFNTDVRVTFGPTNGNDQNSGFSAASDSSAFDLAPAVLGSLELQRKGIFTANISVALANLPVTTGSYTGTYEQFRKINLVMTRHTSLLINSWAAKDQQQTESRIDKMALFPGRVIARVLPVLDLAVGVIESPSCFTGSCIRAPKLGKLDFWNDMVPADRLK